MQVCPTGIDIRKGLQYECIGCAACIDACDGVMDKMDYPRGLIRYATQNGIAQQLDARADVEARAAAARAGLRRACCCAIAAAFVASLALRAPFKVDVVRDRGALARMVDDGRIENVYRLQLMNATERPQRFRIDVDGLARRDARSGGRRRARRRPRRAGCRSRCSCRRRRRAALGAGAHPMQFRIALIGRAHGPMRRPPPPAPAELREKSTFVVPR